MKDDEMMTAEEREQEIARMNDAMDRICLSCYGEGKYCASCDSSVLFCELYQQCDENEKRHEPCDSCNGTGERVTPESPERSG